jgi:hypothetical protein
MAMEARVKAGWRTVEHPPAVRYVRFTFYRHRLLDMDNPYIKPWLDSIKGSGGLIWDDRPAYCALLPHVQLPVPMAEPERTIIDVFLVDPRERRAEDERLRGPEE